MCGVGGGESHADAIADGEVLRRLHDAAFDWRSEDAGKSAAIGHASDHRIEHLAHTRRKQDSCRLLVDEARALAGVVLLRGAVRGDRGELGVGVGRCRARDRGFHQTLGDEVGVAPVWCCAVRVVGRGEAEVTRAGFTRWLDDILAGAQRV